VHAFASAINCSKNASRFLEHHFAGNSKRHSPRRAIQELRPDLGFELRDLMRHGRLRKIAGVCRPREMAQLGHSHECSQMDGIHDK
jgi:hypothetical protein